MKAYANVAYLSHSFVRPLRQCMIVKHSKFPPPFPHIFSISFLVHFPADECQTAQRDYQAFE